MADVVIHNKRLFRMVRLLQRLRPAAMPVTYRHNRVVLYSNGQKFFQVMFAALRSAQTNIIAEYYLIRNDSTGGTFAEELIKALNRGVKVYLIYDYIGCIDTASSYFKKLSNAGVKLLPFNVPSFRRGIGWFDRRDHRKMTVIDGKLAFLGGFNMGDEYADQKPQKERFHDCGFSIAGSAVQELESLFAKTWQIEHSKKIPLPKIDQNYRHYPGYATVSFISGGPHHRYSFIRSAFLFNITSASEELLIANPYFVPGPRIIRALLRAAQRGVRVRLLMPAHSDVPLVQLVGRSFYGILLKGGIEIYEMTTEILHAKVMLVDGERAFIGSANMDQRSFHRNFEINAIIDSSAFGRQIRVMLTSDIASATPVVLDEHESRGLIRRTLERVARLFSWFL